VVDGGLDFDVREARRVGEEGREVPKDEKSDEEKELVADEG
jgi:hypothetical protein